MALKSAVPFPLSPPLIYTPDRRRSSALTEIRFSRWNNANAEPFLRIQRHQKQIEDDIRRLRRFQSASKIADPPESIKFSSSLALSPPFEHKSQGTPSSPSLPSIPGKASKYSKPENPSPPLPESEPVVRSSRKAWVPPAEPDGGTGISVSEKGVSYRIKNSPFEFQYSYTETPKVKPLALREPPFLPFGPMTMPRPWTGRAPLLKKKLPELGSFKSPPPGKNRSKRMATREGILGEPLADEEVEELINGCLKTNRQLNIGRDGLTHNMLDNIHAHWKRQKVCKIKCKGVCTVDMDNVRQQLEERTGGKIIWCRGGVIYLYRGRNYNYRDRPKLPLMLWKPIDPVYPRLVQRVPEGLTLETATKMRKKGRHLPSLCKLGKNGVYFNLVSTVREAFEECELAKIDCEGIEKSDCRKIGAKLRDLVPCVLISFKFEHILMWRGKNWKSSLPALTSVVKAAIDTCDSLVEGEEMTVKTSIDTDDDTVTVCAANPEHHNESPSLSSVASKENCCLFIPGSEEDDSLHFSQINCSSEDLAESTVNHTPWLDLIMLLFNQAVEAGKAVVLNEKILDADAVLSESVALATKAPRGLVFCNPSERFASEKVRKLKGEEDAAETLARNPALSKLQA